MWIALAVALGSVAAGTALGFLVGQRGVAIARAVAAIAAAIAVLLLLPHAWEGLGALCIAVGAVGFALPTALEWAGGEDAPAHDVAFAGLLAHQLIDGLGLGVLHDHSGVLVALGAHVVPMSAAVVLSFGADRKAVWQRGIPMALAIALGAGLGGLVPEESISVGEPWVAALASGLLLHIALHAGNHEHDHP